MENCWKRRRNWNVCDKKATRTDFFITTKFCLQIIKVILRCYLNRIGYMKQTRHHGQNFTGKFVPPNFLNNKFFLIYKRSICR